MEVKVSLEHSLTLDNLESKHLQLIEWFHRFLFSEILEFSGCPTVTGCRIVLMGSTDSNLQAFSAKRPYSPTTITKIDYEYMRKLKHRVENWSEEILAVTDLNDAIVVKKYAVSHAEPNKTSPQKYVVTEVRQDLTTLSEFPNQSQGRTFNDYYKNKHNLDIKDVSQPLLEVIPFRYKIDCRRKPNSSSKHHVELLVPELCNLKESPQSLAIHASFLPSVLYRLQSLLAMHELSEALPTGVGYMLRNGFYEHEGFRESPSKKYRSCQPPDDDKTYSDLCNECEDICDAPSLREETSLSTLQEYFSRFDSSSFVPLFSLLEALTCASSSDAFDLERLEMLGDSFLKMAVSIYVYWHEDHKDEGKLTKYRSRQISNKNLFKLAETKGLPGYLKHEVLSKSTWSPPGYTLPSSSENGARKNKKEECSGSFEGTLHDEEVARQLIPDKSIADSVEALIGAHLTHCGYMGALKFMTWLGLKVLHEEKDTNHVSSCYAEYPIPQVDISEGEDEYRYGEILRQQTCEMETFQRNIGYVFENKVLLLEAFTHPTYSDNTITGSYQRLEFLGDAILDFLVTQHIYNHCSENLAPGLLTDLRCALVNNNIFGTIAVENDFQRYLREYSPELFSNIGSFVKAVKEYQVESGNKVSSFDLLRIYKNLAAEFTLHTSTIIVVT